MNELENNISKFESIKHIDEFGNEYWSARELMKALNYNKWENFHKVINQAIIACKSSNFNALEHFPDVRKMLEVGKKIRKTIKELGGTMPEDLPTPNKSLKEIEKEKKLLNK